MLARLPAALAVLLGFFAATVRGTVPDPSTWAAVLADLPADTSIEQVAALPDHRFTPYDAAVAHATTDRNHRPPAWLKLRLPSVGPESRTAILVVGRGFEDIVDLYEPDFAGGWRRLRAGESIPPSERAWPGLRNALPVRLPAPGEERIVYLRIVEDIAPEWSLTLEPDLAAFTARQQRTIAVFLAYFGAMAAIFAYNLFLYVRLRYRDLLYYLCYLAAFGTMMAVETYATALVVPLSGAWRETGLISLFNLSLAALLMFVREYHELRTHAPRLARVLRWLAGLFAAAAGLFWWDSSTGLGLLFYQINILLAGITLIAVPISSLVAWRRGARQAPFFLVAFGCYALAMLVVLVNSEFLNILSEPAEELVALAGSAAEFLLLSFAISDRFRRIREEKDALQANYTAQLERDVATRTAELARLNTEKDELMGIVAHDLRAPLGALRGTAQLVRRSPTVTAPDDREALDDIAAAADRMLHLANTLLDRHAVERAQFPVHLVVADVRPALSDTARRFRDLAAAKRQILALDLPPGPLAARHDPALLAQVLDNLLSNALKFSPSGSTLRLAGSRTTDDHVRLAVHDAGPGLSDADLAKLFQPFARLDARPTAGEDSAGLGLAAARKLTLAMHGRIGADNAPAGGAVFWIELPAG